MVAHIRNPFILMVRWEEEAGGLPESLRASWPEVSSTAETRDPATAKWRRTTPHHSQNCPLNLHICAWALCLHTTHIHTHSCPGAYVYVTTTYTQIYICALEHMCTHHTHTRRSTHYHMHIIQTYIHTHTEIYTRVPEHMCTYHIPHTQGNKIYFSENVLPSPPIFKQLHMMSGALKRNWSL